MKGVPAYSRDSQHEPQESLRVPQASGLMTSGGAISPSETWTLGDIRWRHWILAALLALLFHFLFLLPKIPGFLAPSPSSPPRVDIKTVDPRKLEAIRKQWRDQQLLLDKDKSKPSADEADPNARYMSDRNIRVEKEQRARNHIVVPKQGAPGAPTRSQPRSETKPKPPQARSRKIPRLGALGVPLPIAPKHPDPPPSRAENSKRPQPPAQRSGENGGEQYVNDPNLPAGSENLLNAQESIYYSFYARLYEAIGPVWQSKIRETSRSRTLQPGEYSTQLDVVFDKDGNLLAINQVTGSGIAEFDQAAKTAWKSMGRFPNPPSGLLDANGEVHTGWTFTVQVNQGFGLQSMPPERVY